VAGAVLLVVLGLLPVRAAMRAVAEGWDVYLFLTGMMLLSELARREGLFDWLAARAARHARGSAPRLFLLIYAVGTLVTIFLSNDATAVVLTPAVLAVTRAAKVETPLPYLLICAFTANAASFVLPISNPANLVLYASNTPPLFAWLGRFGLPAAASILVTFIVLRLTQRNALRQEISSTVAQPELSAAGRAAAGGIVATGLALLAAAGSGIHLGLPTALCGIATLGIVLALKRAAPWPVLGGVSWAVLPLVAGLFVLVQGLEQTGILAGLARLLRDGARQDALGTAWAAGTGLALISNLMNNLPAGLIAAHAIAHAKPPHIVTSALLIGVDLGPNLSVTGSLATILWLTALRRGGLEIGFWQFLRLGALVMPPALLLALAGLMLAE
jgi:arsenical pump membrane protein